MLRRDTVSTDARPQEHWLETEAGPPSNGKFEAATQRLGSLGTPSAVSCFVIVRKLHEKMGEEDVDAEHIDRRLSLRAPENQAELMFTYSFALVWAGAAVVTVNSKLLGGKLSFFQSVCVLGYCIFPLVLAACLTLLVGSLILFRVLMVAVGFAWSVYASIGFFSDISLDRRRILAVYPIFFFYFVLSWLVSRSCAKL